MFDELEDAAAVHAQAFPNCVASLNNGIEWAHPSLFAMDQLAVDVDDQVAVPLIEALQQTNSPSINGADVRRAGGRARGPHPAVRTVPEAPPDSSACTVGTKWTSTQRHTNVSPRRHRCRVGPAARRASIR